MLGRGEGKRVLPVNQILVGDAVEQLRTLPANCVHTVVTSPPYWGLRDYKTEGQIGLEATPQEFIEKLVAVFREVRRVLHPEGTCWINMGDCYTDGGRGDDTGSSLQGTRAGQAESRKVKVRQRAVTGLRPKNLVGQPWRLAFALQADGWYLRMDNIWAKKNCMPESAKDRPTRAHEYVFLLSKREEYFYDSVAVEEPASEHERSRRLARMDRGQATTYKLLRDEGNGQTPPGKTGAARCEEARQALALKGTRNRRSVWWIGTQPSKVKHFATFPEKLVEPCIAAGTSEKGSCDVCGAQVQRILRPIAEYRSILLANRGRNHSRQEREDGRHGTAMQCRKNVRPDYQTIGWERRCGCRFGGVSKSIVLDPFMGSGTTAAVALRMGRDFIGVELNPAYAELAQRRVARLLSGGGG